MVGLLGWHGRRKDQPLIDAAVMSKVAARKLTADMVVRAFIAANARLRPGMLGVACANSVLQEVRICFSKDLRDFHACPEVSRQGCRVREVSVPPIL